MQATIRTHPQPREKTTEPQRKITEIERVYLRLLELCNRAELPINFPSDALYLLRKKNKIRSIDLEHIDSEICTAIWAAASELRIEIDMVAVMRLAGLDRWSSMIPSWYPHLNKSERIRERIGAICERNPLGSPVYQAAIMIYRANKTAMHETTVSIAAATSVWMGYLKSPDRRRLSIKRIAGMCGISAASILARKKHIENRIRTVEKSSGLKYKAGGTKE